MALYFAVGISVTAMVSGKNVVGSTNFKLTCKLKISGAITLSAITLKLVDFNGHIIASTNDLAQANVGIVFMPPSLKVSHAGQYMCVAMLQGTAGNNGFKSLPINLIIGSKPISLHVCMYMCECVHV